MYGMRETKSSTSIYIALLVAALILLGQAQQTKATEEENTETSGAQESCDNPLCSNCTGASGSQTCTGCYAQYGAAFAGTTPEDCSVCDTTCTNCGPTVKTCTKCSLGGTGPDHSASNGSCAACGDYCTICDNSGSGKCDPTGCNVKYAYDTTTGTCKPCRGANCPGCTVPNTCPTCQDGFGLNSDINNPKPPGDCRPCSVLHAQQCTADYKKIVLCLAGYTANYFSNKCNPTCAVATPTNWRGQPPKPGISLLETPVPMLVVHQTLTRFSSSYLVGLGIVRNIQLGNLLPIIRNKRGQAIKNLGGGMKDIYCHFFIGSDQSIYSGRSLSNCGQHTFSRDTTGNSINCNSICVAFLGNFKQQAPSIAAMNAFDRLLAILTNFYISTPGCPTQSVQYLQPSWKMFAHRDKECTLCPGAALTRELTRLYGPNGIRSQNKNRYTPNPNLNCRVGRNNNVRTNLHPVKK